MSQKLSRAEQSRINGSKSRGPSTPAGLQASKEACVIHGFRSNTVAVCVEDKEAYDAHLDAYLARYQPIDKVEADLVGLVALNMFLIMRVASIEAALFDVELSEIEAEVEDNFLRMDDYGRLALAFRKSSGENVHEVLRRYKATVERAYHRALQDIETMIEKRRNQPPVPVPAPEKQISTDEPEKTPPDRAPLPENAPEPVPTSVQPAKTVLQIVPKPVTQVIAPAEDLEWRPKFGS